MAGKVTGNRSDDPWVVLNYFECSESDPTLEPDRPYTN